MKKEKQISCHSQVSLLGISTLFPRPLRERVAVGRVRGFTLVELLITIVIIGVLAAIAVSAYQKAILKSRFSSVIPPTKAIADSQEFYYLNNGKYAKETDELDIKPQQNSKTDIVLSDMKNYKFVMGTHTGIPEASYIVYQKHSKRFADNIHCQAVKNNALANWLCKTGLGGTLLTGSLEGSGYLTYVISGNPGTDKFLRDDCPTGYYDKEGVCTKASVGNYAENGEEKACPAGTYQGLPGYSSCNQCGAGTYAATEGNTRCTSCPAGTYQSETGQTECLKCPVGTANNGSGRSSCYKCSAGFYANTEGTINCSPCPGGTYQPEAGQAECFTCPAGTSANGNGGSVACTPCPAGKYGDTEGSKSCHGCPYGTYQPKTGQTECLKCPVGTYGGSWYATACNVCPVGTYNATEGSYVCNNCLRGTYQPKTGQTECLKCPSGTFAKYNGQSSCDECAEGYYTDAEGQYSCKKCPSGQTNNETHTGCVPIV